MLCFSLTKTTQSLTDDAQHMRYFYRGTDGSHVTEKS